LRTRTYELRGEFRNGGKSGLRGKPALVIIREKLLRPILAGIRKPTTGHKPTNCTPIDQHYENIRQDMFTLMQDLRIAA
jgi:hypothetical protein